MASRTGVILLLFVFLSCGVAHAAIEGHNLRARIFYSSPTGDRIEERDVFEEFVIKAEDSAVGFEIAWEILLTERFGINLGVATVEHDVDLDTEGLNFNRNYVGQARITPICLSGLFHVTPQAIVDLYAGAGVAFVLYGDLEFPSSVVNLGIDDSMSLKTDTGFFLQLGIDVPIGDSGFMINGDVKYFDTSADPDDGGEELEINPWFVGGGIGFSF